MAEYKMRDLNTWEEFLGVVGDFEKEQVALRLKMPGVRIPDMLFRGQRESHWSLLTTLERYRPTSLSLSHYYTSIWAAKSQIEAHTNQRWEMMAPDAYRKLVRDGDAGLRFKAEFPGYDYMAYLRHHGFPSPLLDWTKSPYVAAFFAFREAGADEDGTGKVAIFANRETSGAGKAGMIGNPGIEVRGPYVRTHKRHFLQQCQYTVCSAFKDPGPQWHYTSHEQVFSPPAGPPMPGQDLLWKVTLPRSERQRVLAYLDQHNLNAYSLFGSEESLMEMMAARELLTR